jgi:hypothetical protein
MATTRRRPSGNGDGYKPQKKGRWADANAPGRIRQIAYPIEDRTGWVGLGDFLVACAATESGGNMTACAGVRGATLDTPCPGNTARGWFQLRPKSALAYEYEYLVDSDPDILRREAAAQVAFAAWYAYRLRNYAKSGQLVDWLAIRRGWALPRLVSDVDEVAEVKGYAPGERSGDVRERFERGVAMAGLDDSFMYARAYPPGFVWPGIANVLDLAYSAANV